MSVYRTVGPLVLSLYYPILIILSGKEDMYNSMNAFEFPPDRTFGYEVICP